MIAYNVKEKEWIELANNDFGAVAIASLLTDEPDSILIQTSIKVSVKKIALNIAPFEMPLIQVWGIFYLK